MEGISLGEVRELGPNIHRGRRNEPPQQDNKHHITKLRRVVEECSVNLEPRPTILIRNISTYSKQSDIAMSFDTKEKKIVKDVEILHSKEKTHKILPRILVRAKILENPDIIVDGVEVTAEPFRGFQHYPDLYQKGRYEMEVSGFTVSENDKGETMYREVESLFEECPNTGIWFYRDEHTKYTG
ncbi:hypothetical protein Tco_0270075 [Tanacetum coccineum]